MGAQLCRHDGEDKSNVELIAEAPSYPNQSPCQNACGHQEDDSLELILQTIFQSISQEVEATSLSTFPDCPEMTDFGIAANEAAEVMDCKEVDVSSDMPKEIDSKFTYACVEFKSLPSHGEREPVSLSSEVEHKMVTDPDGSVYTGQLFRGRRHGEGVWRGAPESYCRSFAGQWQAGRPEGKGRQVWVDGRVYEGQYAAGHFQGKGRMVWEGISMSGARSYDGQWTNDLPNGFGRQECMNEGLYEGQFVDGKFEGQGHMVWRDTLLDIMAYDGHFKNHKKHGSGKLSWPDGRFYNGDWRFGKRSGTGYYAHENGDQGMSRTDGEKFLIWLSRRPQYAKRLGSWLGDLDSADPEPLSHQEEAAFERLARSLIAKRRGFRNPFRRTKWV